MCPWLARAAYDASDSGTPSARTRNPATSAVVGVARVTSRQRERMVGRTSSTVGAQSIQTVRAVGSSIALSSALQACSVSRSASSMMMTWLPWPTGISAARSTSSRIDLTPMLSISVVTLVTSACEPASTVWHSWHSPQPASSGARSHCSAAANATAALERPEPGGPVNSHAWLIPWPDAADRSASTTRCCPTRSSQTGHDPPCRRLAQQRPQPLVDGGRDLLDRQPGVEHEVVVGVGRREVEERLARALVELERLGLDPVAALEPAQPLARVDVEDDGQVRPQPVGRPSRHRLDLGRRRARGRRPGRPAACRRSGR